MKPPRMLKHLVLTVWMVLLAAPVVTNAQSTDLTRLRSAIERNTELLAEAVVLVRETNSVKARAALETARRLHEASMSQFGEGNHLLAGRAAHEAYEAILHTIAIARREAKLEESALKAIERAAGRLEQARAALDELGGRDDAPARKMVEEARQQFLRAQNNMREHMFEVALQLANASHELSTRALRMLRRDAVTPEVVRREIARTDNIIGRADERGAAVRALADAKEMQQRAKQSASNGRLRLALDQTHRAREMALRAMKSSDLSDSDPADVARALALTDDVLENAAEIARESDEKSAKRALDQLRDAGEMQRRARARFEEGRLPAAMQLTIRARDAAKNALGAIEKPVDRAAVRSALAQTEEAIERLRAAAGERGDDDVGALLERAVARQAEAVRAFESGEFHKALALTRVARNLAGNALRQLNHE